MSKIEPTSYEDFAKSELCEVDESGFVNRKGTARDFVLKLLEERPYSRLEVMQLAEGAGFYFDSKRDSEINVNFAIASLLREGVVEGRYDRHDQIIYGLKSPKK